MTDSTVVRFADESFACGLTWLVMPGEGGRRRWTVRQAQLLGATWYAERSRQTGFWAGPEPDRREGRLASLADLVARNVAVDGEADWQALVECAEGRFLVVRGRGETLLPDGDEVVEGSDEAVAVFVGSGERGALWATPGLVPGARELPHRLEGERVTLAPVPLARGSSRRRLIAGAAAVAALAGLGIFGYWAWQTYQELTRPPAPEMVSKTIIEGVDGERFLDGCMAARRARQVLAPMWEPATVECVAVKPGPPEVAGQFPEGVLLVRWQLRSESNDALARRLAEGRLGKWNLGAVLIRTAWAAAGVSAPIRTWDGDEPSDGEFRREVDRAFGTLGALAWGPQGDGFGVVVRTRYPLSVVRERLAGIRWLDFVSAIRTGSHWEIAVRRVRPRVIQVPAEGASS